MPDTSPVVLFDLDDTLIDRDAAYRRWAEWFVADRALGPDAVEFLCEADQHGYEARPVLFEAARRHFGLGEDVASLVAEYPHRYLSFFAAEPPVQAALRRLRATGWRIGVVTNGPAMQLDKVARAGLEDLVDAVCASGLVGATKPEPAIFEEALRRLGGADAADAVWMVGDSMANDIGGGRQMGFRTIWMQRGRRWSLDEFRPDHEVPDVPAAAAVLEAHRG